MVDRDEAGVATRIAAFGLMEPLPDKHPVEGATGGIQWSLDAGREWTNKVCPAGWRWQEEHEGRFYNRGTLEGSLVRAANGWLVGAFRTDAHPKYFSGHDDNHCGIGTSVSKDNGLTWSSVQLVFEAGKHHTHLLCMPDGTLVMTYAVRLDVAEGRLASYGRGCGALLSYDNGLTWDTDHEYLLHHFDFSDGTPLGYCCGHAYSAILQDQSILTCYGNLTTKGACLIRWRPTSKQESE